MATLDLTGAEPVLHLIDSNDPKRRGATEPQAATSPEDQTLGVSITVGSDPQSARVARRFVRDAMDSWGLTNQVDDACLAVSELVTNAVTHAQSRATITVVKTETGAQLRVRDEDVRAPVQRVASETDTSGRGIQLIDAVSDTWGVEPADPDGRPFEFGAGKVIWLDFNSH